MSAKINTNDPYNHMFQYDGEKVVYSVRFSMDPVAKASHRWLVAVLGDQLKDLETRAYNKGKQDARDAVKLALGI